MINDMDMNSKIYIYVYSNEEDANVSFPMRKYVLLLRRNEQAHREGKNKPQPRVVRARFARCYTYEYESVGNLAFMNYLLSIFLNKING